MRLAPSDELLLLHRPFTAYRALADRAPPPGSALWRALRRPLFALLIIGSFVSVTTAGRLVAHHLLLAALGWAFVPIIQTTWLLLLRLRAGRSRSAADTIDLFFAGQGGWYLVALAMMTVVIIAPGLADRAHGMQWALIIFSSAMIALVHSVITTAAFVRHVWSLTRLQTFRVTGTYYLAVSASILGYYLWMGQLMPLLVPP